MRNTKTEYVSCPSCGRTLFDLQASSEKGLLRCLGLRACQPAVPSPSLPVRR